MDALKMLDSLTDSCYVPDFLSGYLRYLAVNKNRSPATLKSEFITLREFLQFFAYKEKAQCVPTSAASFRYMNASLISCQRVASITAEEIEEYLYFLDLTLKNTAATVNKKLTCLRQFFRYLYAQRLELGIQMDSDPTATLYGAFAAKPELNLLSGEHSGALLQSIRGANAVRDYAIILLILTTGMTLNEVIRLDYPADYEKDRLHIRSGNQRTVYLPTDVQLAIAAYLRDYRNPIADQLRDKALFVSTRDFRRLGDRGIQVMIAKHVKAAGLTSLGFTAKDLRDTAICAALRKASPSDRRFILEHFGIRDPKAAKRYDSVRSTGRNSLIASLVIQATSQLTN